MSSVTHEYILQQEANYWRIEANHSHAQWERAMEELEKYRWQPIETAPKDGKTEVLVCEFGCVYIGIFDKEGFCQDMYGVGLHPTYWMPLPKST